MNLRRPLLIGALAVGPFTSHALAFDLGNALGYTERMSAVLNAKEELKAATANNARVAQDPLAVRLDKVEAAQREELAAASYEQSRYNAMKDLASAYLRALQAAEQRTLAEKGLLLSEQGLKIAQIRLENGSATDFDLDDARNGLEQAQNGVRAAKDGETLALRSLSSLLGQEIAAGTLEPLSSNYLLKVPQLGRVKQNSKRSPNLLNIAHKTQLARLGRDALDPLFAAKTQIDDAARGLKVAQSGLADAKRGFSLQVEGTHTQATMAARNLKTRAQSAANAQRKYQTQVQRYQGGLISKVQLEQAELQARRAEMQAHSASAAYVNALLNVQASGMTALGAPYPTLPAASQPAASLPASPQVTPQATPQPTSSTKGNGQ